MRGAYAGPQGEYRILYVKLAVPKPVLYARDTEKIARDSGQQVRARIREHRGERKLQLKAPSEIDGAVFLQAVEQALNLIRGNHELEQD